MFHVEHFPRCLTLFVAALLAAGCARGRIEGGWFLSASGGYRFRLPGEGWTMISDGWKHQWELGYRNIFIEETYKYITRKREVTVRGRKVIMEETDKEVDKPARIEQRDVFEVDAAFAYRGRDLKMIVATARVGDLFRYLKEYGVYPDPGDRQAIGRAYLELYPSVVLAGKGYRFEPGMKLDGATVDYLELLSGPAARSILAGRLLGDRLVVAYYRARGDIPDEALKKSRRDFQTLVATITSYEKQSPR